VAERAKVRFLADDIWDMPEDGNQYEVIDGELYVTPSPAWAHQRVLSRLHIRVGSWVYEHDLGEIVEAPTGVVLDAETGVQPDLLYISRERLGIISQRGVEGAPDLVVEVLSPSTSSRDRGVKMRRYAAAGIPHYWLVDLNARAIEPFRLGQAGYEPTGGYGPGTVFEPELFPGLKIAIDDLFA
jgi:Uma2 family endonuclease